MTPRTTVALFALLIGCVLGHIAACRTPDTKPTITKGRLEVTGVHPCIKKVRVTIVQGAQTVQLELSPTGGSVRQELPSTIDPKSPLTAEVEILETELECVVKKGDLFSFQGVPTPEGDEVYALPIGMFAAGVITKKGPAFGVTNDCLDAIIKRMRELAKLLGVDINNKRIELVPADNTDGGGFETLPDPKDPNKITIKVTRDICDLIGKKLFDLAIAHELDHISRYGTPGGDEVSRLRDEAKATDQAAHQAAVNGAPDRFKKKRDAVAKEIEFLEALIEEEKRAYNSSDDNKDKLGLSDEDLRKNREMRDKYIQKLEADLEKAKKLLQTLPP